jgi:hypothetical protein
MSTGISVCPELRHSRHSSSVSFLFRKSAAVYNRRRSKITSILCSFFTASYVMKWHTYFPDTPLRYVPSFDARIVIYPGMREVRDYFSWRQTDSVSHLPAKGDSDLISYQPTLTTYTTPLFGPSFIKEGNQTKTPTSLSAYASRGRFFIRSYLITFAIV